MTVNIQLNIQTVKLKKRIGPSEVDFWAIEKCDPNHLFLLMANWCLISKQNLNFSILILLLNVLKPTMQAHIQIFKHRPDKRFNSFATNENDIFLIIKYLNADKAHGWHNISIRKIELCGKKFYYFIFFNQC